MDDSTLPPAPVNADSAAPSCECCGSDECQTWTCDGCARERCEDESRCECCEECESCCECHTCSRSRCSARFPADETCDSCDRCPDCCGCVSCNRCGERHHEDSDDTRTDDHGNTYCDGCWPYVYCDVCSCDVGPDNYCSECYRCDECCNCNGGECNVRLIAPRAKPKFHAPRKDQRERNPSPRFLSCELECSAAEEGDSISRTVERWGGAIVEDGSLPDSGFEVCTAPAGGDLFLEQAEQLCAAFRSQGAEVNDDCGYHVHADARDLNWWDVRRLVLLYARVEEALFSVVPPSRRKSHYCKPCGKLYAEAVSDPRNLKNGLLGKLYGISTESKGKGRAAAVKGATKQKYNGARYHALNLHSWLYRGTVECRLAAGTTDREKVINWALLWGALVDFAAHRTDKDLSALPSDSWECLLAVAPSDSVREWLVSRRAKFAK